MRRIIAALVVGLLSVGSGAGAQQVHDVVIYGGTSAGVAAAIQAGRMGKTVVLIEPTRFLGGLTTGGLGATDIGNAGAIGGVSREFYQRIRKHYLDKGAWQYETIEAYQKRERLMQPNSDVMFGFEPRVASLIYDQMLGEVKDKVSIVLGERLDLKTGVEKEGQRVALIRMESGKAFAGKMFVDATYEGDLMAKAGVSYTVGREANAQYGETLNGIQVALAKSHQFGVNVDPYVKPGDPASGLLPFVHAGPPGTDGTGDKRVQAYNYRMCLTDAKENQTPFPKPEGYDEKDYELLLRQYEAGFNGIPYNARGMPNRKTDSNNTGAFSTDFIGMNYDYPDGDYATREKIVAAHVKYQKGLMWTLANHPRVPQAVRDRVGKWGLAKDEFADNGNWPRQLYVREARRMVGEYVVTENDVWGKRKAEDPIGCGSYGMDSHNTQRYVDAKGFARNEGDVQVHGFPPYGVSYKAMVPKRGEAANLIVPVCLSATHISYGSIRMEPVFMIMGQSAATAACLAIDEKVDVQAVPYAKLRERLLADKQIVEWTKGAAGGGGGPTGKVIEIKDLPGVVVDAKAAKLTGEWTKGTGHAGVDGDYHHDGDAGKGEKTARFELKVPADGRYEVRLAYVPHANRSTAVPVTIDAGDGPKTVKVDEQKRPPVDGAFVSLGTFAARAGTPIVVTVSNAGTSGYVVVDAVQAVPAK